MKTTIIIELETKGFLDLYEMLNPDTMEPLEPDEHHDNPVYGDVVYNEAQFHADIIREVENVFDYNIPERIIEDKFPENWEYLSDCCQKITLKVNGVDITKRCYLVNRK